MAKFNTQTKVRPRARSPIKTVPGLRTWTHEGAEAHVRDAESALFVLAATNMVGEDTYYESAAVRDERYRDLIRKVVETNPAFIAGIDPAAGKIGLAQYLRQNLFMRSASVVLAAEYVAAGGPDGRDVVRRALGRADEPGELLAYWHTLYGRSLPAAIKRGVADAVTKLYNEHSALRYDGTGRAFRLGDVIELVHATPKDAKQSALFKYLLDKRHHSEDAVVPEALTMLRAEREFAALTPAERRDAFRRDPGVLQRAGINFERLSGYIDGGLDAEAWNALILSDALGYMALLRNLRNFTQAGISPGAVARVRQRLVDPEEVARSKQFPFRFYSAYKHTVDDFTWAETLDRGLDLVTQNIPKLDGSTLILVDVSGSMQTKLSAKSTVARWETGAVFAAATHKASGGKARLVAFGTDSAELDIRGISAIRTIEGLHDVVRHGRLGWGTNAYPALAHHYNMEKRVVIFTDEQVHPYGSVEASIADSVPTIYTFNLGGYRPAMESTEKAGRHTLGGFSDATFVLMETLERGRVASWPF